MARSTLAVALASLLTLNAAHAQTSSPPGGMRETPLVFDNAFVTKRAPLIAPNERTDCVSLGDANTFFEERVHPSADSPVPPEEIRSWDGSKARAFIAAAWTDDERRGEPGIGGVERVYVRTRPDIVGFAKVHFADPGRGFVCGFRTPVIITTARLEFGIHGRPEPSMDELWPKGDPLPGMSRNDVEGLKTILGLRNQFERGTEQEKRDAMEGMRQLMRPGMSYNGAAPPPLPQGLPKVDPKYAPTISEMQELAQPKPRGCESVPIENCIIIKRR